MPEVLDDINYEVNRGDPKPKPSLSDKDRAKLDGIVKAMVKNKESDKVIQAVVSDFKSRYATIPSQSQQQPVLTTKSEPQPITNISSNQLQPIPASTTAFVPMTDWMAPIKIKTTLPKQTVTTNDHTIKTTQAIDDVKREIEQIDPYISNFLYNRKKDIEGRVKSIELGISPKESIPLTPQAAEIENKLRQDIAIKPEEIEQYKTEMNQNPGMLRDVLDQQIKDLSKTDPGRANRLKGNLYRIDAQGRPDNEKKISKNVEKINKGEIEYDPRRGMLYNPHGFFGSLVLGYKDKNQLFKDYETYTKTENEAAIIKELNSKMKDYDPDEPIDIPQGALGEAGAMLGGQPIKPIVGGAIAGYFGTPASGAAAAAGISAHEMYKLGYASELPKNYISIKKQHPDIPDYEAYQQAKALAEKQATIDAASGAAMGLVGAKAAFKPTGLGTRLLQKSVTRALGEIGEEAAKKSLEGLAVGGVGGAGQVIKNIMAQKAGIPTSTDEGVAQQLIAGASLTAGMAILAKSPYLLKKNTYNTLAHNISKLPEDVINQEFNDLENIGYISTEELQNAQRAIREQKEINQSIPDDIPETDRLKVQAKIKERNILEQQLEKVDPAYHPELKEKIKSLNEEIVNISKGSDRGDLQKIIDKELKEGNIEGYTVEILKNASEGELKQYMKEIAEQAHDPASEKMTYETFGKAIVDKAKELFPKEVEKKIIDNSSSMEDKIKYISQKTGIDLKKSLNTNSWYGVKNDVNIRISDHPSKFVEKTKSGMGGDAIDLDFKYFHPDAIVHILNDTNPFEQYKKGDKIIHSYDKIGEVTYLNSDYKKGYVEVETRDGRIVKYDMDKFLGKDYKENPNQKTLKSEEKPVEEIGHIEITEHGEDTKTADGLENGIKPSELSKEGIKEAKELGRELADSNKNRIVTSEIERAKQTANEAVKEAKNISGKDIPVETNKLLNTWDIGEYDGKPEGTFVEQAWINKPDEAPKGGESFNDFKSRMEEAYKYVKSLPEDTHVVGHSKVMRALSALEKTDGRWTDETTKDFLTNKELTNAIQEPSTGSILQYPQEGTGGEGSERGRMEPGEQGEISSRTHSEEEGKGTSDKKEVGSGGIPPNMFDLPFTPEEGDVSRLAHADTEQLYREMGMGERIPRATKTDIKLEEEADNLIKEGYDFIGKADRVLNGMDKSFSDAEQVAFAKMVGALKAKLNNTPIESPEFNAIQSQIEKLSRASDIVGSEEGAAFRARRMFVLNNESLSDFLTRAKQANKDAPLTEEETKEVKKQWDEFDAAKKGYEEKIAKLQDELAKAKAEKEVKKISSTTKRTKRTPEERAAYRKKEIEAAKEALNKLKKGGGSLYSVPIPGIPQLMAIAPHVKNIMIDILDQGITEFSEIVKKLHSEFKGVLDGLTEKHVIDILAGEYNKKKPKRSELMEKVYDIKKQAELINKLERMKAGVQPKSEKAIRKRNQETEALKKQIKDLQKEEVEASKFYGENEAAEKKLDKLRDELDRIKDRKEKEAAEKGSTEEKNMSDREKELRDEIDKAQKEWNKEKEAARQAKKDYVKIESERNRQLQKVADLKEKLSELQKGIKSKGATKEKKIDTPEIESLKEQVADAEKELNKTIATEKRIKQLEDELDRVKNRRTKEAKETNKRLLSEKENILKKQIEEEKKKWTQEEKKTPEELALNALKSRYKKLAEEYERKLKEGDFEKDADVPPLILDKEAQDAKDRYIEAKKKWELKIAKKEYENRTWEQKSADFGLGVLDLKRAIGTAYDFSVPFRQALPVTINPLRIAETSRAFKQMFTQWYSGKSLDRWWFDLENSADYKEMIEDGVPVHSPNELRISKREEEFRTRLAEQIPVVGEGVKMSNRAASGYLNSLRVDMYRKQRKIMEARGITRQNNPEVYKELGKYIGNMTGSGNLLSWLEGKPSKALGSIFFGAKLMAAKFNLLNPYYYAKIPKEFIKTALIDLGMRVGMYTTIGYLFNAAGFSVSLNPNDPDFLKVKHGNTTYDITGGEAIYVRTFLRVMGAAWQRISGEEKSSLKAAEKAGASVTAFFRNKLAPTPSYGLDMFLGKTAWGAKADPYDIVRIYPMWIDDIVEDWEQDKANSILLAGIPSIMGIGVMSKQNKKGGSSGGAGASGHYKEQKTNKNKEHKHK